MTSIGADVIFLSDLRLNNNHDSIRDLENAFMSTPNKQYVFVYNSTKTSRGTGILISMSLDCKIIDEFRDNDENIMGLLCSINSTPCLLISIYGPNSNDCSRFFECLHDMLGKNQNVPYILGGDWNCTLSCTAHVESNIDIFSMKNIPSSVRSLAVAELCNSFDLSDPYRILHPSKREFTYVPRNKAQNRSRLDFFLVSDSLIDSISVCNISQSILTELFDHKYVSLILNKTEVNVNVRISPVTLKHVMIEYIIKFAVNDSFLSHLCPYTHGALINELSNLVGNLAYMIHEINDIEAKMLLKPANVTELTRLYNNKMRDIVEISEHLPTNIFYENVTLTCDWDVFLEVMLGNIKNEIISFQSWSRKAKNAHRNILTKQVNHLREDFLNNSGKIHEIEIELNRISEFEIRAKIENMKQFEYLNHERATPLFLSLGKKGGGEGGGSKPNL